VIEKFFGNDLKQCDNPFGRLLSKSMSPNTIEEKVEMQKIPYRNAVGTLLWLSLGTRPGVSYAVSQVARYNDCYGKEHWQAVKRIFRYLKGTINLDLKHSSIDRSTKFTDQFESLWNIGDRKSFIYKSLHQSTIKVEDICALTGLVRINGY